MRALPEWMIVAGLTATLAIGLPMAVSLVPPPGPGDSGDTGHDTGDTGGDTADTADTGADTADTGADTADTGADTADSGVPSDSADTADTADTAVTDTAELPLEAAWKTAGEEGGFGCSAVGTGAVGAAWLVGLTVLARRRRD